MHHAITTGYFGRDWLHRQKPHKARTCIRVRKTEDGIIFLRAAVISTGVGNHGIRKTGTGVISTEHGMITTRAVRLSTWIEEARGEIGKNPTDRIIIHMHRGMLWTTLSMRKIFKT
jgi:hypothetical protein